MPDPKDAHQAPNFDIAALPGATVAAVLAAVMPSGPYGYLSLIIGVTIFSILLAYEGGRIRSKKQSAALACSMGLVAILICGFIFEWFLTRLKGIPVNCVGSACESAVAGECVFAIWFIAAIASFFGDRYFLQPKLG